MKFLTNIDLSRNQLQNVALQHLAVAPGSPFQGQIYFNTTENRAFVYNGTSWVGMDAVGATMTGDNIVDAINDTATSRILTSRLAEEVITESELSSTLSGYSTTSHNHSLDSLSNVSLSSPANGNILRYNGSHWVNNTLAQAGIQPAGSYQSSSTELTAIAGVAGTSGLLRKTAANTWSLDTSTYATTGQLHAPATVSSSSSITLDIIGQQISANANFGTSAGTVAEGNHTHAAYVNQNAYSSVVAGGTTVSANSASAALNIAAGTNVSLSGNDTTKTITISAVNTTYSNATTSTSGLMSNTDKSKLDGIATGAQVNVKSDWNASSGDAEILNKPTLGTAASRNVGISAGNVPALDANGKLNTSILPALTITETFVVANQSAMLALSAQIGDVAIRTDINKSFILRVDGAATLANWQELLTPTDAVHSVNGKTGEVSLTASDVGAASTSHTHSAVSNAGPFRVDTTHGYVDIGPANTGWCHFSTDRPSFYMSKGLAVTGTLLKGPSYNLNVPAVFIQSTTPTASQTGDIWFQV